VLVQSLQANAPDSVINCPSPLFAGCPAGLSIVPMVGTAPLARIYAFKVFPSQGGGAPESRIIKAMDRAITLRRNFNDGVPQVPVAGDGSEDNPFQYEALDIRVVNMSLGGPTLNAGRDIEDQLTLAMLDAGITIVTSAGNDGFAAMTGGSPGTGVGSLTVGASNTPVHERVLRDIQFGVGIGPLFRPFDGVQTAYFSARGPTADGRFDPDLSANGFGSFVNAFAAVVGNQLVSCGHPLAPPASCLPRILFVGGTSFASPTAAGAAALLRGAVPAASAAQTRKALILGANPSIVTDGSGRIDQGAGFVDVTAALGLLESGEVSDGLPRKEKRDDRDDEPDDVGAGGRSVLSNLQKLGIKPVRFVNNRYTTSVRDLKPGQVAPTSRRWRRR
jgi:subtilisin family serine protease